MAADSDSPILYLLLGIAVLVTAVVHLEFIPAYFPDDPARAAPFLVVGWFTFGVAFYAMGRLFSTPGSLPSMRGGDVGTALFLLSLLAAAGLDTLGFTPDTILVAYVPPAIGIYAGLALLGWAVGKRTKAINRMAHERA